MKCIRKGTPLTTIQQLNLSFNQPKQINKKWLCSLQCALLLMALTSSAGERWRWPDAEGAESVRIDTKVGFVDDQGNSKRNNRGNIQADEITFQQPTDTQGFYNRPPGNGRYPVRVERVRDDPDIRINGRPAPNNGGHTNEKYQDGTLDSLQYCKCASTPDCEVRTDYAKACDANQYLCCYNDPGKQNGLQSVAQITEANKNSVIPRYGLASSQRSRVPAPTPV
ncbi:jg15619 [Pararge aegeria aegeria]|uniref:Jg15619 protein n=1 Tax=Pararge aegeria aegeria TaxID=348720 RepID=A0A8S4RWN8_9NEOP|nr:jg15619 [Pararge aegeria aegeria]